MNLWRGFSEGPAGFKITHTRDEQTLIRKPVRARL